MDTTMRSCREFVKLLASAAPTPGGGGAAALVGAIGTALGNMVGALTVGKKKYVAVEEEIRMLMLRCDALQQALLDQVEEDARCFAPLALAYAIPKDEPERDEQLERAKREACTAPLRIMELCAEALEAIQVFALKGSRLAVSDAGCAAACCRAALESASLNLFINTRDMKDRVVADALNADADALLERSLSAAEQIFNSVRTQLRTKIGGE